MPAARGFHSERFVLRCASIAITTMSLTPPAAGDDERVVFERFEWIAAAVAAAALPAQSGD